MWGTASVWLTQSAKPVRAAMASGFRRYAAWLVATTWKRFILLSVLLLIIAGVLGNLPPFTWQISQRTVKASRVHQHAGDTSITLDDKGVQIKRKPAAAAPSAPPSQGAQPEPVESADAQTEEEITTGPDGERIHYVRLGDFLPNLAFLFIVVSAAIKIAYAGRIKAEERASEAQAVAEAESLKRQVVEARLAAMQAQVEPHFLFNTLASIDHLIEVDPPRASRMQKNLIALLRASMPAMRERATNLGRELEVVRPYLEILKVRMEQRLQAELNIPEGLYSADFPPMMLQSLVENAIKHGLEPKPEGGALSVAAVVAHGKLMVSVADTGVGFGRAPTAGTGLGLSSVRERLKLIYGAEAELQVADNAPSGTRVTIVVPYRSV